MSGDSERQALLRDRMIKKEAKIEKSRYVSKISSVLKPNMRLLDIGCGTGHIIQALAHHHKNVFFVGLDISSGMLKKAKENTINIPNITLVEGDGLQLPFSEYSFDIVITKLAEYSPKEAYGTVKKGGYFFEYGLGPEADKEIAEFFKDRIEEENFFFPQDVSKWKEEVCVNIKNVGFAVSTIEEYKEKDCFQNEEELMDTIEMVPLVQDFNREKERGIVAELAKKYRDDQGIKTTWHYYILEARRL